MDHNIQELYNVSFSEAFFEDEVREGFFVTSMMKRYWASQLKVLSVIASICQKHDINWFADYGTLMGSVRHGGYIPWDDDLDICMLRSDWLKYFEAAKKELPEGYVIMTLDEQEEYRELIGRVVNSHAINFSPAHMKQFFGCPYTVGVDIFPLDGLYDDPAKEEERKARAQKVLDAYGIICAEGEKSHRLKFLLQDIEKDNNVHLKMGAGLERAIVLLLDRIYRECSDTRVSRVALMRLYMQYGNHIYDRRMFEEYVDLPFENTYVRVPVMYDVKLRLDYGNYMNVVKSGGVHNYPVYSDQEQILSEHIGKKPFRYNMDNNALLKSVRRYIMRATSSDPEKEIKKIVFLPCRAGWWKTMEPLWRRAINAAGIEVHVLPIPYNERNHAGDYLDDHDEKSLFPENIKVEDHEQFDFESEHPDVIVMQVPYDDFSTFMAVPDYYYSHNLLQYTDELIYVPCFDPDAPVSDGDKAETAISVLIEQPAVVNADRVVLKSEKMKQVYIKKLVELTGEPTRGYWNQKIVLEKDIEWGNGNALTDGDNVDNDKPDDNVDYSLELCGTADNQYGGSSIIKKTAEDLSTGEWNDLVGDTNGRKVIAYYVSISFLIENGSKAVTKIRHSLNIFNESSDSILAVFLPQRAILTDLPRIDETLWHEYESLIGEIGRSWENVIYDPDSVTERFIDRCDAFYGDPGVIARQFVLENKPVMLQNADV